MKVITVAAPISPAMIISSSRSSIRSSINVPPVGRSGGLFSPPDLASSRGGATPRIASGNPLHFCWPMIFPGRRLSTLPDHALVHRTAAGLFQELLDQGLTDPRGHLLVDRHHRLAHRLVLLRRQRNDLVCAVLLERQKRLLDSLGRLTI